MKGVYLHTRIILKNRKIPGLCPGAHNGKNIMSNNIMSNHTTNLPTDHNYAIRVASEKGDESSVKLLLVNAIIKPLFNVDRFEHCNFRCVDACRQGFRFQHSDPESEDMNSWFDDFEYHYYRDSDGIEHRIPCHTHLGVDYSYVHSYKDIPKEWTLVKMDPPANSDEIKKEIGDLQLPSSQRLEN